MEVTTLKMLRSELEEKLKLVIEEFEKKTDVDVYDIEFTPKHYNTLIDGTSYTGRKVNVRVKINL